MSRSASSKTFTSDVTRSDAFRRGSSRLLQSRALAIYSEITHCRLCRNSEFVSILDLGVQCLTGVFPKANESDPPAAPLELVRCASHSGCGLVQLRYSVDPELMYGENYGYRSSLNRAMVRHLESIVQKLRNVVKVGPADLVLDIGSNDGTLLGFYDDDVTRVGMDPTIAKFSGYYKEGIIAESSFFSREKFNEVSGGRKARIVTSIAMLYDLADPIEFAKQVRDILAPDGVWFFEQSHLPAMLAANAYDTVCHEHLEYYALTQIRWMLDQCDLKIIDVEFNDVNGGSFAVMAAPKESTFTEPSRSIEEILANEAVMENALLEFSDRVARHRELLLSALEREAKRGSVLGYGASTKGNVLLQYCGITPSLVRCIADVNEEKFGRITPGTRVPIVSEAEALALNPDVLLVLPWHFRDFIVKKEQGFLSRGGRLLFPLPEIEFVSS